MKKLFLLFNILFFISLDLKSQTWLFSTFGDGSIIQNSSNNFTINGNNNDVPDGYNFIYLTVSNNQTISFNWSYSTLDRDGPGFDPFYYKIGSDNIVLLSNDGGSRTQSGVESIVFSSSGVFQLGIYSTDGTLGGSNVTISNLLITNNSVLTISAPTSSLASCFGTSSSSPTTFGVSGSGLTSSVTITAPSNFEISTSSGGTYSSSLTLPNASTVNETLYIRINSSATAGDKTGTITARSTGVTDATTSVNGTVNSIPTIIITETDVSGISYNDDIICNGASATLNVSGGSSYSWSSGDNTSQIIKSPSTNTTYTVTGTTAGCSNTASKTITVNAIPTISITETDVSGVSNNDAIICNGALATLTASGGSSYLWSSGDNTSQIIKSPSTNTTYTVTGTTAGCSNIANKNLIVYSLPNIGISGSRTNVDLVSLTATGGSTYAWSDGSSISTASNTFDASGLYSLSVTDANGCISSTNLNITVQHWGLSSSGAKTLDSAIQINSSGQIGSLNPLTQDGKKSEYKVRIIRDGLVLNLDAGNSSSYPGTGSTWTDLSGNNNHGTLENGPTYSSANGGSIVFDGVNDRVSAFPTQISGTGSKTISLWIKINTTSRTGLAGTRSLSEWGWGFTVNRNGTGTLAFYDTRGSDLNVAAGLGTNIWYNVSVTYDNSRIVTLYVNGLQVGISSTPFAALNASTFNGVIGNEDEYESFTHPFKGNIAQVAIYNRALTANEVLNNYNALKSRFGM